MGGKIQSHKLFFINSLFAISMGIAMIVLGTQITDIDKIYIPHDKISMIGNAGAALIVVGVFFIVIGLLTTCAVSADSPKFLPVVLAPNVTFLLIFAGIFGYSTAFIQVIDENLSVSQCKTGYLQEANESFNKLQEVWCRNKPMHIFQQDVDVGCGCYIPDYSNWSEEEQVLLKDKNIYSNIQSVEPNAKRTVDKCEYFPQIAYDKQEAIQILKVIESQFQCTGICEGDLVYYFNDVSAGRPTSSQGCFQVIAQKAMFYLKTIQSVSIVVFTYVLVSIVLMIIAFCREINSN